jgi:heterodisulfide reductase subunit B
MKEICYYPGCTLKLQAKNFESSALSMFSELGIKLKEVKRWNCCGTVSSLTIDDLMHHIASVRNLIRIKEEGENKVVTLCSMCYNVLKMTNNRMKNNQEELEKINKFMDEEEVKYNGEVEVFHGLTLLKEIGLDVLGEKIINPLQGIKIVPYYGCLLLRPEEVKIDNSERPTILEEIITTIGGEVVDFPYKNECCGTYHTVDKVEVVVEKIYSILNYAIESGAHLVITSCPLCEFNLDRRQKEVKEKYTNFKTIPVVYFSQAICVAMGIKEKEILRTDLNWIDPKEVFNL